MDDLRVIADDLTGACDVGAEFLPWPGGVVVQPWCERAGAPSGPPPRGLCVRNTQTRTVAEAAARAGVLAALADLSPRWRGILLKKIDTGLRGHLGAELDAAMGAVGAAEAFVLPAIPEIGRTTVGGIQRIGGVPVHETAFANDPQNPVRASRVGDVIALGTSRPVGEVGLATIRGADGGAAGVGAERTRGRAIVVCDAEHDTDLARVVEMLVGRPRPLVVAGSIGLARALRACLGGDPPRDAAGAPAPERGGGGVLLVMGSAHPTAWTQLDHVRRALEPTVIGLDGTVAERVGVDAAARLRAGALVALVAPRRTQTHGSAMILADLERAAAVALAAGDASGCVCVGGETAFHVLRGLGHPLVRLDARCEPLSVRGRLATGRLAGLRLATKGGSSGDVECLVRLVKDVAGQTVVHP